MSCTLMLYLSTAFLLVTLFADAPAHGQRCAYSEGRVESCGYPRTISGTPGQHVVYMDTTDSSISTTLCGSSVTNVVWFEVRPTVSGPLIFSTCHPLTSYDTVVVAYSGGNTECQGITEVTCNDDDQSDGCDNGCSYRASTVTIPNAIANTWYRFAVGEYSGSSGTCTNCLGVVVTVGTPCGDAPHSAGASLDVRSPVGLRPQVRSRFCENVAPSGLLFGYDGQENPGSQRK